MTSFTEPNLINATKDSYTPFVYFDSGIYTDWISCLMGCLTGDPSEEDYRGVHSLVRELATAADALIRYEAQEAREAVAKAGGAS